MNHTLATRRVRSRDPTRPPNPKKKKSGKPVMFKVKTQAWLDKLKEECGENEGLFEKLK